MHYFCLSLRHSVLQEQKHPMNKQHSRWSQSQNQSFVSMSHVPAAGKCNLVFKSNYSTWTFTNEQMGFMCSDSLITYAQHDLHCVLKQHRCGLNEAEVSVPHSVSVHCWEIFVDLLLFFSRSCQCCLFLRCLCLSQDFQC